MNALKAQRLTKEAVPTCGARDGFSDRYRVWVSTRASETAPAYDIVVKARTKKELYKALVEVPFGENINV